MINKQLINLSSPASSGGNTEAEQGLILHLDANDVDSYDGDGNEWVDISTFGKAIPISDNADDLELHLNASDSASYSGSGTTWVDISNNSRNATIGGGFESTFDKDNGGYFHLDGSDADEATVSHDAALDITSTGLTVEAWVNPDDTNYNTLVAKFSTSASIDGYALAFNTGDIFWRLYTASASVGTCNYTSGSVATSNTWHHIVGTVSGTASGSTMRLYRNGELLNTATTTGTYVPTTRDVKIGGYDYANTRNFDGKIGAVRIYSKALSVSEVGQNYRHGRDTVYTDLIDDTNLELHLDADSFPEKGESGYSNTPSTWTALTGSNGTISGATFDSESGNYLNFDGSGDTVTIGTQSYFHSTNDFTAELWVKRTTTNEDTIFRLGTAHPTYYLLYNDSVGFWFNDYTSSPRRETRTGAVPETLNQWTHITLVVDGGNIAPKIYINGEHKSILANGANGGTSGNKDLIIGQGYPAALWGDWHGAIGQVRWYSSKLTDAQIRQNYNFTKNDYPNGFDATISGASFHPDGYLEFNGSSHFAYIDSTTNSSPVDFSKKNYSIAAWVNLDNVNTFNYVLSKYGTSDSARSIIFGVNNNGTLRLLERSSSSNNQYSTGVLTTGTWHHIAVVRTFDKISFYINGLLDTEISNSFTPNDGGNQRIAIGRHESTGPLYFDGKMSDIKLYDKALTSSEVASQFAIKQFQIG